MALKPDGIVVGGFDANEQKRRSNRRQAAGIPIVGWHAGTRAGPEAEAGIFANVTTDPLDVSDTAARPTRSRIPAARPAS